MKKVLLLLPLLLFAFDRDLHIKKINQIIGIYHQRIHCLENNEAATCINRYPLDPKSDALAKTFSMSFPKSYYKALLQRDIKLLEKEKICYGRSITEEEAQKCLRK